MEYDSTILPYPIYVGTGLSHGIVIPPQQLESLLRGTSPRPAVFLPGLVPERLSGLNLDEKHPGLSISMHIYLFSNEGQQVINSPPTTIAHLEPSFLSPHLDNGFSLSVNYLGTLILHTSKGELRSNTFTMAHNVWYKLSFVFYANSLLMVTANGTPIINMSNSTTSVGTMTQETASEQSKMGTKLSRRNWPFGALCLGNTGLKESQIGSGNTGWLKELCYGAISGLQITKHSEFEMLAFFRYYIPSTTDSAPLSSLDAEKTSIINQSNALERLSAIGTLEKALGGSPCPKFAFPPDSFPMPSRICRPLFAVSELDHWEDYLGAFSKLKLSALKPISLQPRVPRSGPTVLLCHDFRGGYFQDASWERSPMTSSAITSFDASNATNSAEKETLPLSLSVMDGRAQALLSSFVPSVYTFTHWSYIDIFVYFSHSRVSIPPAATIQAAHSNGVQVLGTLITEWDAGYMDTMHLIAGKEGDKTYYARKLVQIASELNFEGWLVNIEHPMKAAEVEALAAWLKEFKRLANEVGQKIVWYDSVINTGELKWQSALNEKNIMFFDSCDYFFTDYHWKLSNLETSYLACKGEFNKVMIGIDIWGRGTYGGGGWNTAAALKAIARTGNSEASDSGTSDSDDPLVKNRPSHHHHGSSTSHLLHLAPNQDDSDDSKFSVALFAPGWTIESQADSFDSLYRNETRFWQGNEYWNVFSKQFEPKLEIFYRLYQRNKEADEDFTVQDILSPFEYSEDGTAWAAERQAAAYSQSSPNAVSGRFPGLAQLFEPRTAGSQWSWRHIRFDISDTVLTSEYMDHQPELNLSVWFKGNGPNPHDPFRVRVLLLDSKNQLVSEFDSGVLKGSSEWRQLSFVWREYGAGVRRILWLDGSRDAENWAGFYGCTIDRPSILIANPHIGHSVSTFSTPRILKNASLPFVSTFNLGQGTMMYSNGSPIQYQLPSGAMWYNLAAQSQIPSLNVSFEAISQISGPLSPLPLTSPSSPAASGSSTPSLPARPASPPHTLTFGDRRPISASHTKIIRYVSARIVDASSIDGGVWQGSSCLKIEASISASDPHHPLHAKSAPKIEVTTKGPNDVSNTSHAVSPTVPSVSSLKRRRSSLKLLFEASKLQSPAELATISLYPLTIDVGLSVTLKFVCRPIHVPVNSMVRVIVTRRLNDSDNPIELEPLSWDLLSNEHRDPDAPSSLGWIHFTATWACEPMVTYTGVNLAVLAVQMSADLMPGSPRSPRSPRLTHTQSYPTSSQAAVPPRHTPTTQLSSHLALLVGFLRLEADTASSVPNPPLSTPISARRESSSPLGLDYKLTWSTKSIFTEAPHFDLTAHWRCPEVPSHLAHLGPPHFIVTATTVQRSDPEGPAEVTVIDQGKSWTPSWVISALPAIGDLIFTVNTVYPDYSHPSHLTDRIQIQWPLSDPPQPF